MFEMERRLCFLLISADLYDVFVFIDNHVLIVLYSRQYINISFPTLGVVDNEPQARETGRPLPTSWTINKVTYLLNLCTF